jgi:hypothetical protein
MRAKPVNIPSRADAIALGPGGSLEFLALQKDTSFGTNVFGYTLGREGNSFYLQTKTSPYCAI